MTFIRSLNCGNPKFANLILLRHGCVDENAKFQLNNSRFIPVRPKKTVTWGVQNNKWVKLSPVSTYSLNTLWLNGVILREVNNLQ